jgi:hypothetical protein
VLQKEDESVILGKLVKYHSDDSVTNIIKMSYHGVLSNCLLLFRQLIFLLKVNSGLKMPGKQKQRPRRPKEVHKIIQQ